MNRILIFVLLLPAIAWGQTTSTTQTTQVDNTIRGKIYNPLSAADMFQALINSRADGTASGTNTYAVVTNGARFTAYSQVNTFRITFTNANTSTTCSLNANSIGALAIKGNDGNDLAVGAIKAGGTYDLKYNGTNLRVMNDGSGSGGGFSNPMTTAGDIIYGGASGTPTRLATGSGFLKGGTTPSWASVSLAADVTTSISGLLKGDGSAVVQAVLNTDYANPAYVDAKVADAINDGTTTIAPSQNAVFDALALKSNAFTAITADATTARTIVTGDNLKKINFSNAGAITITLNSSAAVGTAVWIWKVAGSGDITLTTSGTTLNATDDQLLTDNSGAVVVYEGSNVWSASGNLGAAATGGGTWGSITGTLSAQTDLQSALDLKAPLASPAFTGNPTAPTQSAGNNSTRISNTAYTDAKVAEAITNGVTGIAPSEDQVFDALALKQGTITFGTGVLTALGVNIGSAGAPVLFNGAGGTPSSLTGTNITGTASGLTAGSVTTNANLTGPITSSGNATSVAAQTGTGSTFVMNTAPTMTNPVVGTQSANDNSTKAASTAYVDAALTSITCTALASSTYTPSLTNVTNVAASTAYVTGYFRLGTTVTVFGKVDIDATLAASSATELGIALPIASNLTGEQDLGGTAVSDAVASLTARIKGDATNDRASVVFKALSLNNDSYSFEFSYIIK